jgi:hypothetical protein
MLTKKPIPRQIKNTNAMAHGGPVANRKWRHVSAGAPVIAHTDGKSPAASWDDDTRTRSGALVGGVQAEELIEATVKALG